MEDVEHERYVAECEREARELEMHEAIREIIREHDRRLAAKLRKRARALGKRHPEIMALWDLADILEADDG